MNKIFLTFLVVLLSFPSFALAQDESEDKEVGKPKRDIIHFMDDKYGDFYQKATVPNLSKLYWLKGALDIRNDKTVDNFVLINDCDLYKKYIIDDFKWEEVRKATRKYIKGHVSEYSDRFKIVIPLDLGRYDTERQGFDLVNYTKIENMKRVKIGGNNKSVCGKDWAIPYYPKNAVLVLNKPYSYSFLKMEESLAKSFIERYNKTKPSIPLEFSQKTYGRPVFARIRMRFLEYQDIHKELYETPSAVMFGRVDGIDIFQNADETGLIFSETYHEPDEKVIIGQQDSAKRSSEKAGELFNDKSQDVSVKDIEGSAEIKSQ